jgi:hypothetical protein
MGEMSFDFLDQPLDRFPLRVLPDRALAGDPLKTVLLRERS